MKRGILILSLIITVLISSSVSPKNRKAPGFALFNAQGKLVTSTSLKKRGNIILSFWASYCKPCIREISQLAEIENRYRAEKNVHLILINIDKEGKEKALPILEEFNITNECLMDIYQLTAKQYIPTLMVPALFLIDISGNITFQAIGEKGDTLEKLEKAIQKLR